MNGCVELDLNYFHKKEYLRRLVLEYLVQLNSRIPSFLNTWAYLKASDVGIHVIPYEGEEDEDPDQYFLANAETLKIAVQKLINIFSHAHTDFHFYPITNQKEEIYLVSWSGGFAPDVLFNRLKVIDGLKIKYDRARNALYPHENSFELGGVDYRYKLDDRGLLIFCESQKSVDLFLDKAN